MTDELILRLEHEARERPDPGTWSRLAIELGRVGRQDDAFHVALQAVSLDPCAPARDIIPPSWDHGMGTNVYRAVEWSGLRQLRAPRKLESIPGGPLYRAPDVPSVVDLGCGFAAWRAGQDLVGVDVLGSAVAWRREGLSPIRRSGSTLLATKREAGRSVIEWLSARTGISSRPALVVDADDQSLVQTVGEHLVVRQRLNESSRSSPSHESWRTSVFSLEGEGLIGRSPGRALIAKIEGELALVFDRNDSLIVTDPTGKERFRASLAHFFVPPEAVVLKEELLVESRHGDRRLGFLDLRTGAIRVGSPLPAGGVLWSANEDILMLDHQGTLMAVDRGTLAPLWSGFEPDRLRSAERYVLTRDSLLAIVGGWSRELALVSADPRTGRELSRVDLRGAWAPMSQPEPFRLELSLIAGRVLILSEGGSRSPLVVEGNLGDPQRADDQGHVRS